MIWRDSKTSVNVNVKIMIDQSSNLKFSMICRRIKDFFLFYGAQNVCVEPSGKQVLLCNVAWASPPFSETQN
uniref:Uncharacterized protein n=1 Tax=Romanomermis culicivorax TaxID=13658 RepID=A0A915KK46_ROMCU